MLQKVKQLFLVNKFTVFSRFQQIVNFQRWNVKYSISETQMTKLFLFY